MNENCVKELSDANGPTTPNESLTVLHSIWKTLHAKYDILRRQTNILTNYICKESNKPLPKKFRRSLRLNKSAKRKGYGVFMSDEDKRCLRFLVKFC